MSPIIINIIGIMMLLISLLPKSIISYYRSYNYLLLSTYIVLSNVLYLILITILLCLLYKYLCIHFTDEKTEAQKLWNV